MDWNYAYTPHIWPLVFTALALIPLAVYSIRRRSVPGALPFAFALLLAGLWTFGIGLEVAAVESSTKIFWIKFQSAMLLPVTTAVTCFLLEYARPGRWLTRRNLALLSIPWLLNVGMILTNDIHHLAWQGFTWNGEMVSVNGLGNWIFLGYVYGLAIVNLVVLVGLFIRSPQHRWPAALIMAGQVGARVVYGLEAIRVIHTTLPIEIYAFWIPIPMYFIALFAFRIFDPIPLARQMVIEQLCDGMLVLDAQGRVASLNPAASQILAAPLKQVKGKPIEEILPENLNLNSLQVDGRDISKPIEITMGSGDETHCYELKFSPLDDFRGVPVGRLLMLHDVTEQRRYQAQILEQQRALSMLQEREQLARELHDGLGQVLAAVHLQASAAGMLLERGKTSQMGECLDGLASTTLQAEAELREYLLGVQSVDSVEQSFLATLQEYLRRFNHQFNLPVELSVSSELAGRELPQTVAVQLLRIIQEGLSNTRKHAHARYAQVSLTLSGERLQVIISDDGLGFDPSPVVTQPGAGFGLRSMRERVDALGGTLQIDSGPEKGTRVVVNVPIPSPSAGNRKPT